MKTWVLASLLFATSAVQAGNVMDNKIVGGSCQSEDWQLVSEAVKSSIAAQSNPKKVIARVQRILAEEMTTRCHRVMDSQPMPSIPEETTGQFLVASSTDSYLIEVSLMKWAPNQINHVGITRVK